jgi:hypothetical protein
MAYGAQQVSIGRTVALAAPMRVDEVVLRPLADYPSLPPTFYCRPLRADITVASCAAQFGRFHATCIGCEVGRQHNGGAAPMHVAVKVGAVEYVNHPQYQCIRCGRDGHDEHSKRLLTRLRTVHATSMFLKGASRATSICVSCHNRMAEVSRGFNGKHGEPRKHACLRDTFITYKIGDKLHENVDIGLRSGVPEVYRLLERGYPDAEVELISVVFGGEVVPLKSRLDPLWMISTPWKRRKPKKRDHAEAMPVDSDSEAAETNDEHKICEFRHPRLIDLSGQRFGMLMVTRRADGDGRKNTRWECVCDCGNTVSRQSTNIRSGTATSCGCSRRAPVKVEAPTSDRETADFGLGDEDWDTPLYKVGRPAPSDESTADGNGSARKNGWLPSLSAEDDEAYRASFEEEAQPVEVAKPSLTKLGEAHGLTPTGAFYHLKTRGTIEVETDPNGAALHINNTSGVNGVFWVAEQNKWRAMGFRDGRAVHRGYFDAIEDAAAARAAFDGEIVTTSPEPEWQPSAADRKVLFECPSPLAPAEPSAPIAVPASLAKPAQAATKPACEPKQPVSLMTRKGRRAAAHAEAKAQKKIAQQGRQAPTLQATCSAFMTVLFGVRA